MASARSRNAPTPSVAGARSRYWSFTIYCGSSKLSRTSTSTPFSSGRAPSAAAAASTSAPGRRPEERVSGGRRHELQDEPPALAAAAAASAEPTRAVMVPVMTPSWPERAFTATALVGDATSGTAPAGSTKSAYGPFRSRRSDSRAPTAERVAESVAEPVTLAARMAGTTR